MKIKIPSYKRADKCITADLIPSAELYVHEFEVDEYRSRYKNKIIPIPDDLIGKGMGVIRNFMLDHGDDDEIVMLDDDIKSFGYFENCKRFDMKTDDIIRFFENAFVMIRDMGTILWGVNLQSDKKFYREYSPFSLSSVILGPCMGIIRSNVRFDDRLGLKEDYDFSLQVLNKYRKVLRFNKYHYICGHINVKGGCANYRTFEKELLQAELLQKKWGSKIVKIKRKTQAGNFSINPVVKVPIKGI